MKQTTRLEAYKAIAEGKTVKLVYLSSDGTRSFLLYHPSDDKKKRLVTGSGGDTWEMSPEGPTDKHSTSDRWYIIPEPVKKVKTNTEYLREPTRCPVCDYPGLTGKSLVSDGGKEAYQSITCNRCEATWDDYYSLTSYGDLKNAQGDKLEVTYD